MDPRIREEVWNVWDEILDFEYRILEDVIHSAASKRYVLVDVGCGDRGILGRKGDRLSTLASASVGIDVDGKALAHNTSVAHRICASCYALPLMSGSADIVVCRWLLEHLENPERAIREFARVLRKGGILYIKTPNLWNYSMMLSWLTPVALHNFLRAANGQGANIRTFYRANTRQRLTELASESGFMVRRFESRSYSFMYYSFNKELFSVMRTISRLIGTITGSVHQTLFCVLQKA